MKTTRILLATALLGLLGSLAQAAIPMGTAFAYQGKLGVGTNAANGIYDLRFTPYDAASGGSAVAGPVETNGLPITNGLFSVALDFGGGVFTGASRWLAIEARTNGAASFTPLTPRQLLMPTPYALFASNTATLGGQAASAFAPATGSGAYVAKSGDTMTGPLTLPRNGLVAGADQLVLSGGKVGIGTADPQETLHVSSSGATEERITSTGAGAGDWALGTGWPGIGGNPRSLYLYDYVGTAVRLVINDVGRVGIGTTSPGAALDVRGTVLGGDIAVDSQAENTDSLHPGLLFGETTSGEGIASKRAPGSGNPYGLDFYTLYLPRMSIANNGNVGIGTTSPGATLDVVGNLSTQCHK